MVGVEIFAAFDFVVPDGALTHVAAVRRKATAGGQEEFGAWGYARGLEVVEFLKLRQRHAVALRDLRQGFASDDTVVARRGKIGRAHV